MTRPSDVERTPADGAVWSAILVDRDHLHAPAKDCQHRDVDACRVCCRLHDNAQRVVEPEPVPELSDYRADDLARARVAVWALAAVAGSAVAIVVSALTVAGVIPS